MALVADDSNLQSSKAQSAGSTTYVHSGVRAPNIGEIPRPRRRRRRHFGRTIIYYGALTAGLVAVSGGIIVIQAERVPGNEDLVVKLAEWGRDNGLGPLVTVAESIQYRMNPPAVGGAPDLGILASNAALATHNPTARAGAAAEPLHAPMSTPAHQPLPGEGVFAPIGRDSRDALVQTTFVRPDALHTSYLTGVAWMSHQLRFALHPGYQEPGRPSAGGSWSLPDHVSNAELPSVIATFNSGFKMKDAQGGFYDNGKTSGTLISGAASLVIYRDGHATVGTWDQDVSMSKDVAYVRQNLRPLIEGGAFAPNLNGNVESNWGATVGGDLSVWRSGVGVTAQGDLVYAAGDALTVAALADVLKRAGAVTAMQLDINRSWISFMSYPKSGAGHNPHKLGNFQRPADRYLQPVSRDFIAVTTPGN